MPKGKLFLIIGPSGVGKGTVISLLRSKYPEKFAFPASATTRSPRPGEKEGETYHFLSPSDFQQKIANGEFLEWALVHGQNYYGTLKKPIMDALESGKNVIRELDIQGFESLYREYASEQWFVSIFLLPPSIEILKKRIVNRSPISADELTKRIGSMDFELSKSALCKYQVQTIDGDIPGTFAAVEKIVVAELETAQV